ncbi:SusD/RagB family nutrient-binding outer membrane lipoprotein [Paraflavitalea sp. CAU 1676]|uniref:SusD/RagB family nutrient-binding outer membrane lipoprotein n=1 Tax=Paraflavitalea sp. CAU 1676 TaxID=3032598 RepID=UPI0023DB0A4F|nr:SusD/RagB family nutrient-binding outer membrane lipoprotein [Paraflavitalea sp. CAU 1676]MDF2190642.1 SusD/RagB family nutrient-binding outer membrane lipoprotein [Paraflavitalea sp. CAU 1676]
MKLSISKYTRLLPVVLCAAALQSCDKDFEEINTNPNAVSVPNPPYIFSKALYDGALNSGNASKLLLGTMQYMTSFNDVEGFGSKYVASQVNLSAAVFTASYPNQINEIGEVIKAVKADPTKVNQYAVARIWRVYCFSRLTDLYGDIPYSDAGQGYNLSLFQPKYDQQSAVYADMLKELDEAATALNPGNSTTFGTADLIYQGNTARWKKFAYSLMLRLGMRLTKVDANTAKTWVTKAIAGGVIRDYADIAKVDYVGSGQNINKNPIALQLFNDNYVKADGVSNPEGGKYHQAFIDSLKANNDPRLSVISVVYVGGVPNSTEALQKGLPANINGTKPADFGTYSEPKQTTVLRQNAPLLIFTAAEANFLLAEAALRTWYSGETAADLHEKGIRAAMQQWDLISGNTGTIDAARINSYVAAHALKTAATTAVQTEQVHNQVWVGLFPDAQEAWNNYRRTGYPALVPNNYPGNATGGKLPRRFIYPVAEQTLNPKSYSDAITKQGADDLVTRVWWDKP